MLIDRIYTDDGKDFLKLTPGKANKGRKSYFGGSGAFGTGLWGGRAVFSGGSQAIMDYVTISTPGDSIFFGEMQMGVGSSRYYQGSTSDGIRGINVGGNVESSVKDTIDHFQIPIPGNSVDFGDMTVAKQYLTGCTNGSRGALTQGSAPGHTVIDYITFSTPGNAADWGDPVTDSNCNGGQTDGERGVFAIAGQKIEYLNIGVPATNSTAFGNLGVSGVETGSGAGNGSRATFAGGHTPSPAAYTNSIEYITISTPAAALDFGDDSQTGDNNSGTSDGERGIVCSGAGGNTSLRYLNISTRSNAVKFGVLTLARSLVRAATSGD